MQILPDRTPYGAGNTHVVVEPAQSSRDRGFYEIVEDLDACARTHSHVVEEFDAADFAVHNQPAVPFVADENVGAQSEQEIRDFQFTRGSDGFGQTISGPRV